MHTLVYLLYLLTCIYMLYILYDLHMYMLFFMLQRLNELCDTKSAELEVINILCSCSMHVCCKIFY